MRQIFLDTETTGLNPKSGDRIIEIGCVEVMNRQLTGKNFHYYLNPERDSEEGALAVHGLTTEFLSNKPKFAEIAAELRDYVRDAEIIIHNAPFDVGFLDAEFTRLGVARFAEGIEKVTDTLVLAKQMYPGKRNSLDSLCERYGVSNSHRTLHGALLDAQLLAEVYLAMTRGQNSLTIDLTDTSDEHNDGVLDQPLAAVLVVQASTDELLDHEKLLDGLDKEIKHACVWRTPVEN